MPMKSAPLKRGRGLDAASATGIIAMKPFLPKRLEGLTFGFLVSAMMSFIVSGIATALAAGVAPGFFVLWMSTWLPSWAIAFPTILVVAPMVRRIVANIVKPA